MKLRAAPGRRRRAFARGFALAAAGGLAVAGCTSTVPGATGTAGARTTASSGVRPSPSATQTQAPTAQAGIGTFRWSALADSPLGYRLMPLLAVAGGQLLEFGGLTGNQDKFAGGGAAFDLATGRWRMVPAIPGGAGLPASDPVGSWNPVSAWTGSSLAVANGTVRSCPVAAGRSACWTGVALYDPGAGQWTALTPPRQLTGLTVSAVAWTGSQLVLAAEDARYESGTGRLAVAAYTPATGRWQLITPALPSGHAPRAAELAAGGGRLILWSLWDHRTGSPAQGITVTAGVDVLAMSPGGSWRNVTGAWPQDRLIDSPALTSDGVLVSPSGIWCGEYCSPPVGLNAAGYFANPATLAPTAIPTGPLGQANPTFIWAGDAIIAVDTWDTFSHAGTRISPGDMASYDPATGRWTMLAAVPGRPVLATTAVWTGSELLALTASGKLLAFRG
jgi:hypothetical protein